MRKQIVVVDNGFVFIGDVFLGDSGWCIIEKALNIRQYGTTLGLGQLINGPTKDTVLDDSGTVRVPFARVVFLMDVDVKAWEKAKK